MDLLHFRLFVGREDLAQSFPQPGLALLLQGQPQLCNLLLLRRLPLLALLRQDDILPIGLQPVPLGYPLIRLPVLPPLQLLP